MVQNMTAHGQVGDFIIREIRQQADSGFGLSVKTETGLLNYKIEKRFDKAGAILFRVKGTRDKKVFPTISALVYHHATVSEGMAGTKLLLRPEDAIQFSKAYKQGAGKFGIDTLTAKSPWFIVGADRAQLKAIMGQLLKDGVEGDFLIRDVASEPGCFGISVRMPGGRMPNYLIERKPLPGGGSSSAGFQLRGTAANEVFGSLAMLVYYYSCSMLGVMGQPLKLIPEQKSEIEAFLSSEYADEFASTKELAKSMVPGSTPRKAAAKPVEAGDAGDTGDESDGDAAGADDDGPGAVNNFMSTLAQTQSALATAGSPQFVGGDGGFLLVYTVTLTTGPHANVPPGSSISIALHGANGSTAMRPMPTGAAAFAPSSVYTVPVVLEDVGRVQKVALGLQSGSQDAGPVAWSLRQIKIESSSGQQTNIACKLEFNKSAGFYQECANSSGTAGFATAPLVVGGPTDAYPGIDAQPTAVPNIGLDEDLKRLRLLRAKEQHTQRATSFGERELRTYRAEEDELRGLLANSQLASQGLSAQKNSSIAVSSNLSRQLASLNHTMAQTKAQITAEQKQISSVAATIRQARERVKSERVSLAHANADFMAVKKSTVQDQMALQSLKKAHAELATQVEAEDRRLAKLVSARDSVSREIVVYNRGLLASEERVITVTADLKRWAKEVKDMHKEEHALDESMSNDRRKLQRLKLELQRAQAEEATQHTYDLESKAISRAKATARMEQVSVAAWPQPLRVTVRAGRRR